MHRWGYVFLIVLFSCGEHKPGTGANVPSGKVRLHVGDKEIDADNLDAVLSPTRWWVNMHGDAEGYARERAKFTPELIRVAAMITYLEDTRKEGHYLFLSTTPPQVATDALDGFRAAGMEQYANILRKALNKVNGGELEDLDFQFVDVELLDLNEKQPPMPLIWQYVRNHRQAFYYDELVNKPEK